MQQRKVIIITGSIGAGKTTFLSNMATILRKNWDLDGFLTLPTRRSTGQNQSALSYQLKFIKESTLYPWATKKTDDIGFNFNEEAIDLIEKRLLTSDALKKELIIIDNLGFLEIEGKGFAPLFTKVLNEGEGAIIVSVKKEAVEAFISHFSISSSSIIDLDHIKGKRRKKMLTSELLKMDSEDIGIFSSINGMIEVTFGSILHSIRLPLKGYILVAIQNFFLILFGKELKGRGLFWITLISSGMKSFSPAGSRLKPMLYIFLQGLFFLLPSSLFGWNFITALWGSLLIQMSSLAFKFLSAYILFGSSIFDAYIKAINLLLSSISLPEISIIGVISGLIIAKTLIATIIGIVAYHIDFSGLLFKWRHKVSKYSEGSDQELTNQNWKQSMIGALKDLTLKRFILSFIMIIATIYFFANLPLTNMIAIVIRALIISWMAFVISRRINYNAIIQFLNNRGLSHIADAMKKSINAVLRSKNK